MPIVRNDVSKIEKSRKPGRPKGLPKTGGRRKGTMNRATAELREAASLYSDEALETLAEVMRHSENDVSRIRAATELLDRAHGRPTQLVESAVEAEFKCSTTPSEVRSELDRIFAEHQA